ncbi:MAG: hypothetical protein IT364_00155 [Candidatus Hydrogenedentes bacterium]|nr:hypothetical protein [Candidatus Hydrogenedentota bacterium]
MSKIYEALHLNEVDFAGSSEPLAIAGMPMGTPSREFEEKLLALHRRIESSLAVEDAKVVSIVGMQSVKQGFTYTYELARLASEHLKQRVLILCTQQSGTSQHLLRQPAASIGWEKAVFEDKPLSEAILHVSKPPISVSQLNATPGSLAGLAASHRTQDHLRRLRKRYDLILIDSRPLPDGLDAALLGPLADGTVLIVDAGVARWQVVRSAVEQLVSQQGTFLGVVLNKRRHYIPGFIYQRL